MPILSLTRAQTREFACNNQNAMLMADVATIDYAGCRCCLINGLLVGLVLGAQAVEKFLKAYILLLDPAKRMKDFSHKIADLAHNAEALDSGLDITEFYPLIDRLQTYYQTRYPDNPNQPNDMTTAELIEIDKLVIYLNEHLPMPDEIKYRSGIYSRLFISKERNLDSSLFPADVWLTKQNESVANISENLETRYFEVLEHLYPIV
ncbi:MAG: hypothetical protein H0W77_10185 [Acidobacteria bacterium]|nr:hypothetical protein [Acidobacteriota bacterium]